MKPFLLSSIFIICLLPKVFSTDYYVSSLTGNDARTATEATNPSTPWKTITKINSYFAYLKPGDRVLFKRGETFYGTLKITKSGAAGSPITIGAYGTGNRPVLTGFLTLTDWKATSAGIYESVNASLGTQLNMVLMNGQVQQLGRYPNANASLKGYLILESGSTTSVQDNELTGSWVGAEIVVRSSHWTLDRSKITGQSGTSLTFSPSLTYAAKPKYGYFIQQHLRTLDQAGEWYYNAALKKVHIYTGGTAPTNVKAAALNNVLYISRQNYINISEVRFEGGNTETIYINGCTHININTSEVHFSGENAVRTTNSNNIRFENNIVNESNNDALDFRHTVSYTTIAKNTISNTGTRAGMGQRANDTYQAIIVNGGTNHVIEYNSVINTGYTAIRFDGSYVTIKNNFVDKFCYVKDDGAGVYTANGPKLSWVQRKIIGNIILNGIGANEGTDRPGYFPTEGIYMDDNVTNVDIIGNTVVNCNRGLYLHNSSLIKVQNNTFYNNDLQLGLSHDAIADPIRNCLLTQNTLFSKIQSQTVLSVRSILNDIPLMGKFDSNYYCRPVDDRMVIYSSYVNSSGTKVIADHDLPGWQQTFSKDHNSKITPKQIATYTVKSLIGSNKVTNSAFTSNITGIYGSSCSLAWNNSNVLGTGGSAEVTTSSTADKSSVSMSVGAVSSTKKYILRFKVKGSTNVNMGAYLRLGPSPYTALTETYLRKATNTSGQMEILFENPKSASQTSLIIVAFTKGVKYWIDDIQLFEADVASVDPSNYIRFEYNASTSNKTVSLDGTYIDPKNRTYSNSITLAPYTSAVLIRGGSSVPTPAVALTSPAVNANFAAPATVKLAASASISGATISKVEFYNGSTLLGTDNASPYEWSWSGIPQGSYSVTAKAYGSNNTSSLSDPVPFTVGSATVSKPVVTLTSPTNGASYASPASIRLTATASYSGGSVSKVEFYRGTQLIKTEATAPYDWTWTNVPAGTYAITAKAYGSDGSVSTSTVANVTVGATTKPAVTITSPTINATYNSPANVRLTANATISGATISRVEFYNGSNLVKIEYSAPYDWTWTNVTAGTYSLTAKAYGSNGTTTTSSVVPFTVRSVSAAMVEPFDDASTSSSSGTAFDFKLYPALAVNTVQVQLLSEVAQRYTVQIVNSLGHIVHNEIKISTSANFPVDVSKLIPGTYVLYLSDGAASKSARFIKQ